MSSKNQYWAGMFGGSTIIAIFLIIAFSIFKWFNYDFTINEVSINASNLNLGTDSVRSIDMNAIYLEAQSHLVAELKKGKLVLTPQEYTNNVVNYYNSILLILSVLIAAFSALSFIYLKNQSREVINDVLKSEEFNDSVSEMVIGRAESRIISQLSPLSSEIELLKNKIADMDSEGKIQKDIKL